ncbi:response regulator [Puniceicoccaceae bacterium K14]|nr:response regulator [Puniceicoccaceae bacterium K14]
MEKVLVVDDEEVLRLVLTSLLKKFGYEPITVEGAEAAIELYDDRDEKWAFVMIDLNMPGMSGRELYSEIYSRCPELPIIIMSGEGEEPEVFQEILAESDSCHYLMKPFGMKDLRAAIANLVELPVVH